MVKHFLALEDHSPDELKSLLKQAAELKWWHDLIDKHHRNRTCPDLKTYVENIQSDCKKQAEEIKGLKKRLTLITANRIDKALAQKETPSLVKCPKCGFHSCICDKKTINRHEMDKQMKKSSKEYNETH